MKKLFYIKLVFIITICFGMQTAKAQKIVSEDCMYLSSLHYTAKGMEYWYSKENGGLETITNVPYSKLGCKNCHVKGCDACHAVEKNGKSLYSTEASKNQSM